jgi:hypothetical protein
VGYDFKNYCEFLSMLKHIFFLLILLPLTLFTKDSSGRKLFKLHVGNVYHSKVNFKEQSSDKIGFNLANMRLRGPLYGNKERSLGFIIGYKLAHFDQAAFFDQKDFHLFKLGLEFMSRDFENWNIKGGISTSFDPRNSNSDNSLHKGMVWGVYKYTESIDFHIGSLTRFGLKEKKALPIFGMEWKASDQCTLSFVFPVKVAVQHRLNEKWSLIVRPRFHQSRHKLSEDENISKGFFEYQSLGGELAMKYKESDIWSAVFFAGWSANGSIKTWDSEGKNEAKHKFASGPHIGVSGNLSF